jgi:hypothetical protein
MRVELAFAGIAVKRAQIMHPGRNLLRCVLFWMGPFGEETCGRLERSPEPLAINLLFNPSVPLLLVHPACPIAV